MESRIKYGEITLRVTVFVSVHVLSYLSLSLFVSLPLHVSAIGSAHLGNGRYVLGCASII